MRTTAILTIILVCVTAGAIQMLPDDGATLTVYELDAEIVESPDELCDLSGATVTGETEMRFEYYGDTLVRRIAGMCADWLRINADTIWSVGADTRRENTRFAHGLPYLLPCMSSDANDSVRYSVFMSIDRESRIACSYTSRKGGGFILPGGDTIPSTYCVETVVSDSVATMTDRRWYAEGKIWHVVEQVTMQSGDGEYTTVNICPLSGQPLQSNAIKVMNFGTKSGGGGIYDMLSQLHSTDPNQSLPTEPTYDQPYAFTIDQQGITVTSETADNAIARLFDAAGRQWHEGQASETISTTRLPSGVYLLQISTPTTTHTTKLTINIR
ncbi:MAG: T9SS type A sorting domain-containing protein [Muribaculaceae bacterium]|nr:T9SS type A sorting domain-containing protein [Muribaculaceae bacterium]